MSDSGVFVHNRGLCESDQVGHGTRIWAFAHVMAGAVVGRDCNICDHAFIESGAVVGNQVTIKNAVLVWDKVVIEDEVFLGPNMLFTNDMNPRIGFRKTPDQFLSTTVRRGASVGAGATIVCGVTLGAYCFVGAGAVVTRDVADHALVVGNPAHRIGWMCVCAEKIDANLCCRCGREYRIVSETSGLALR